MVVHTRPSSPEREDEFNAWYDETHVPEVLALPGFVSAKRYRLVPGPGVGTPPANPYLVVYELEGVDVDEVMRSFQEARATGAMRLSDVFDRATVEFHFYERLSP